MTRVSLMVGVAGIVGATTLSILITALIGAAWTACDDIEAGGRFALVFLQLPAAFVVTSAAFGATAFVARSLQYIPRLAVSIVAMLIGAVLVIAVFVPIHGDSYWAEPGPTPDATTKCGPGGIPTWWPIWLPS